MPVPLPIFPSTNSIPPACFYNLDGLQGWLNKNPSYKQYFAGLLPGLLNPLEITSTLSTAGYSYEKVPLCADVTTLSQQQANSYNQQLQLFHKVYTFNSNAYVNNYNNSGPGPIYYRFPDFKEQLNYKASVQLVNKLYPFESMAKARNWQVPFPIFM